MKISQRLLSGVCILFIHQHTGYCENVIPDLPDFNSNSTNMCRFNRAIDGTLDIWSSMLEQYTVEYSDDSRQGKYLPPQKHLPSGGRVYITRRIGEAYDQRPPIHMQDMRPPPLMNMHSSPQITKRIDNKPTKPINLRPGGGRLQTTEISETDLYLLSAIEKLVYRVDYLEKRLKKTDELVLYLMEKQHQQEAAAQQQNQKPSKPPSSDPSNQLTKQNATQQFLSEKQDSLCPPNSTKIGDNCYIVEHSRSGDWQAANSFCKSSANQSQLLEFDSYKEYYDVGHFLSSSKKYRKHNYWLGGLNPGLLWIWSSTAKPVNPFKNELSTDNSNAIPNTKDTNLSDIQGSGRCLSYSFDSTSKHYLFFGQNCNLKMGFLCKLYDLTVENEISRIARLLNAERHTLRV